MTHNLPPVRIFTAVTVVFILVITVLNLQFARAASIVVTTLTDGAGTCPGVNCTLRQAITDANASAGADTITFSVSGTIMLTATLPSITDVAGLTIDGTGQTITISGNNLVGVFKTDTGSVLNLNNLTLTNGSSSLGGAIASNGSVTITNSTLSNNSASQGGAIFANGPLSVNSSTFSGNRESGSGAITINYTGTVTISNSVFTNNTATSGNAGAISNTNSGTISIGAS